jgi:murein DD-endopeptidase MepM/ murein hydrolase activator NlpD
MRKFSWLLVILLVIGSFAGVGAQTKKKVSNLKGKLNTVEKKKDVLESKLKVTKREAAAVMADIGWVDDELQKFAEILDDTERTLRRTQADQKRIAKELQQATEDMEAQEALVQARLKNIYMQQSETMMGAMLTSKSIGDLAMRKSVMERIAEVDRIAFEKFQATVKLVANKKVEQDKIVAEVAATAKKQRDYRRELANARQKKAGYMAELREQMADLNAQYDELEKESNAIEAQILAFQARSTGGVPTMGSGKIIGGLIRPVNARVTSGFGYRNHPILKRRRLHAGIDYGAPTGTPIRAAGSGVVIYAGYRGGYGNTLIIDHGNGVSTLYGHCSKLYVSEGASVRQGQTVAAVGSTGLSTGPHLHFEVRINGKPVNPLSKL